MEKKKKTKFILKKVKKEVNSPLISRNITIQERFKTIQEAYIEVWAQNSLLKDQNNNLRAKLSNYKKMLNCKNNKNILNIASQLIRFLIFI